MNDFPEYNDTIEEYFNNLKNNAKFNTTALFSMINWLAPDFDMEFTYAQRLIGPPSIQCPTGKKWCCTINMANTMDDGMFAFCPADINTALCPNLDPECILLDNPINAESALVFCRAKTEIMDFKYVMNHIKSRMSESIILPESEEINDELEKKLNK